MDVDALTRFVEIQYNIFYHGLQLIGDQYDNDTR